MREVMKKIGILFSISSVFDRWYTGHKWQTNKAFTLIEMMVSITVFAVIIIMAFDVMWNIGILRTQVSSRLDLNSELYGAMEKFVDIVKTGGDIDYEEYWNRKAVGTATQSGHYSIFSGFGNYGSGVIMGTWGCLTGFNTYSGSTVSKFQRYWQYRQQFIDYNANTNYDSGWLLGDEDGNGSIRWDDDDEDLGMGPSAFTWGLGMKELYLIKKWQKSERTYLRWIYKNDPNAPSGVFCQTATSSGCLWNIQVLKLIGRDLWLSHTGVATSSGRYDGIIDTWECHQDYYCTWANNLPTGSDLEWVSIFPEWVNVKNIDFYPYPEKDFRYAWKESGESITLNPYVRIRITLGLAWEKRKIIKGPSADMTLTTTVNLSR